MFFSSLLLIGSRWVRRRHMHTQADADDIENDGDALNRGLFSISRMRTAKCNLNENDSQQIYISVRRRTRPNTESAHGAEWIWRKPSILLFIRLCWRCRFQWFTLEREENGRQLSVGHTRSGVHVMKKSVQNAHTHIAHTNLTQFLLIRALTIDPLWR